VEINVKKGYYYVVIADVKTGIVLTSDGTKNLTQNIPFEIFETFESAERYADEKAYSLPETECSIYNDQSQRVKVISSK
jgi:hypothetical protein